MRLSRVVAELRAAGVAVTSRYPVDLDPMVLGVVQSHQRVTPGALFVARRGASFDGHDMIPAALAAGAVAVLGERADADTGATPYLVTTDTRAALPYVAAAFHQHPSRSVKVAGVTGTDGKTTTSFLLHWLLSDRFDAGLISTAGVRVGQTVLPTEGHFTTPEATEVQALLARFRDAGLSHAVLESSSHGFSLHRLDAVDYRLGVFTNLSSEHLDHHKTWENYREAKATLMRRAGRSVVNLDDGEADYFVAAARSAALPNTELHAAVPPGTGQGDAGKGRSITPHEAGPFGQEPVIGYGRDPGAAVRIERVTVAGSRLELTLDIAGSAHATTLPMLGTYNAHNAAAAVAAAVELGIGPEAAMARLASFPGVPGRMQVVQHEPFLVVVDFAHTAPALDKALREVAARGRRLIVVIGAAGERDPGKRAPLGSVAASLADLTVYTEEDSRSEPLDDILAVMASGARAAGGVEGRDYLLVPDRRQAIRVAIDSAEPGDVVLLAGKGHEHTLERSSETLPWDEVAEAERALHELLRRPR